MLKVQMADGATLTFDLNVPADAERWQDIEADPKKQEAIRAVGVQHQGMWHVMPVPRRFRQISYGAWLSWANSKNGGEKRLASLRVRCQADNVAITMTLYYPNGKSPRMVKTDIKKTGRQVWKPPGGKNVNGTKV